MGWKSDSMYDVYCDTDEDERTFMDLDKLSSVFGGDK